MNTKRILIPILAAIALFSCQKDEDVKPATNPRFSVAYVQNIDASGVEFAANVFEFGSEEILEYGFAFGRFQNPTIETTDIIKATGKPEKTFKLFADFGMQEGIDYYVSAFIVTKSRIVYSEQFKYRSKGSTGFYFDRIESLPKVYFGDTITVIGRNFSTRTDNYRVFFMGNNAQVFDPTNTSFKVIIPPTFEFGDKQGIQGLFDINIQIAGKALDIEWPLDFESAEFSANGTPTVDYGATVSLKGSRLFSESVSVRYKDKEGTYTPLPVELFNDSEIRFGVKGPFTEENPLIEVTVRGRRYLLDNTFNLRGPELEPGQTIDISRFDEITLVGKNFNVDFPSVNRFLVDGHDLTTQVTYIEKNLVRLRVFPGNAYYLPREIEIYPHSLGQIQKVGAKVRFLELELPHLSLSNYIGENEYVVASTSVGEFGYVFTTGKIVEFDPILRRSSLVYEFPQEFRIAGYSFIVSSPNGKIYGSATIIEETFVPLIFEFDPKRKIMTFLPNIPALLVEQNAAYATTEHLYCDGGYFWLQTGGNVALNERWRYSFTKMNWEKLSIESPDYGGNRVQLLSFRFNDQLHRFGPSADSNTSIFSKFDLTSENWSKIMEYSNEIYNLSSNSLPVIGNKAYVGWQNGLGEVNLEDFSVRLVLPHRSFGSPNLVVINNKLYSTSFNRVYEIDPAYFKFD